MNKKPYKTAGKVFDDQEKLLGEDSGTLPSKSEVSNEESGALPSDSEACTKEKTFFDRATYPELDALLGEEKLLEEDSGTLPSKSEVSNEESGALPSDSEAFTNETLEEPTLHIPYIRRKRNEMINEVILEGESFKYIDFNNDYLEEIAELLTEQEKILYIKFLVQKNKELYIKLNKIKK